MEHIRFPQFAYFKPKQKLHPRKFSYMACQNSMVCEFLFSFLTNSTLCARTFGKGLLRSARPRCGTLGKTAWCLFCGGEQQSPLRRLKTKWKNISWVIFPLPILTESMSECTVPSSEAAHGVSFYAHLTKGVPQGAVQRGFRPQTTNPPPAVPLVCLQVLHLQRTPFKEIYS